MMSEGVMGVSAGGGVCVCLCGHGVRQRVRNTPYENPMIGLLLGEFRGGYGGSMYLALRLHR